MPDLAIWWTRNLETTCHRAVVSSATDKGCWPCYRTLLALLAFPLSKSWRRASHDARRTAHGCGSEASSSEAPGARRFCCSTLPTSSLRDRTSTTFASRATLAQSDQLPLTLALRTQTLSCSANEGLRGRDRETEMLARRCIIDSPQLAS